MYVTLNNLEQREWTSNQLLLGFKPQLIDAFPSSWDGKLASRIASHGRLERKKHLGRTARRQWWHSLWIYVSPNPSPCHSLPVPKLSRIWVLRSGRTHCTGTDNTIDESCQQVPIVSEPLYPQVFERVPCGLSESPESAGVFRNHLLQQNRRQEVRFIRSDQCRVPEK